MSNENLSKEQINPALGKGDVIGRFSNDEIYEIEIRWNHLYPWDADKYRTWEIRALVIPKEGYGPNYHHPLNKKIFRKKRDDAYKIVDKWRNEFIKKGFKVVPGLGNRF